MESDGISVAHFLYIPGVFLLGMVLGWIFGQRSLKQESIRQEELARAREQRRLEREERRKAREGREEAP